MICIKELRKQNHITAKQLAEALNVAESAVSLYENGKRAPDFGTLSRIADFFGVSTDYLLGREEQQNSAFDNILPITKKKPSLKTVGIITAVVLGFGVIGSFMPDEEAEENLPKEAEASEEMQRAMPTEDEPAPLYLITDEPEPEAPAEIPELSTESVLPEPEPEPEPAAVYEEPVVTEPTWEPEQTWEPEEEQDTGSEVLMFSEPVDSSQSVMRGTPLFPTYEHDVTDEYVLNSNTKKIHHPDCNDVKKIKPENYSTTTNLDEFFEQGYTKCGHCW